MQLSFSPVSPLARKFRVMIREKGLLGSVQEASGVMMKSGAPAVDPMAQAPVLWESEQRMSDDPVGVIMMLDEIGRGPKLLPENEAERAKALRLLILADGALEAGVQIRTALSQKPSAERDQWIDRWQKAILGGIDAAEQLAPKPEPLTIGTIAITCALSWLDVALPGATWKPTHPNLANLQLMLEQRASFHDVRMSGS